MAGASTSVMASQTLTRLRNPTFLSHRTNPTYLSPKPITLSLLPPPNPTFSLLSFSRPISPLLLTTKKCKIFASSSSSSTTSPPTTPAHPLLTGSTRTITTLFALALSLSRLAASRIPWFALQLKAIFPNPGPDLLATVGPLFFAAIRNPMSSRDAEYVVSTPAKVLAQGISKWLTLYNGILLVRVCLSWFPNIPWDKQPLSAIRDLCDPYLNLFRLVIPPLFNTLDVSPLLAFFVLSVVAGILKVA